MIDVVIDREYHLCPLHLSRKQAIQLCWRPRFPEESVGQNHNAVAALGKAFVDLCAQTIAERQSLLIKPDRQSAALQFSRQGADKIILVLTGMRDEYIIMKRGSAGRSALRRFHCRSSPVRPFVRQW